MQGRENNITQFIRVFTAPLMAPGKRLQARLMPGLPIDFSPVFALILLNILARVVDIVLRYLFI